MYHPATAITNCSPKKNINRLQLIASIHTGLSGSCFSRYSCIREKRKTCYSWALAHAAELGPKVWDGSIETSARPSFTPGSHVVGRRKCESSKLISLMHAAQTSSRANSARDQGCQIKSSVKIKRGKSWRWDGLDSSDAGAVQASDSEGAEYYRIMPEVVTSSMVNWLPSN